MQRNEKPRIRLKFSFLDTSIETLDIEKLTARKPSEISDGEEVHQ